MEDKCTDLSLQISASSTTIIHGSSPNWDLFGDPSMEEPISSRRRSEVSEPKYGEPLLSLELKVQASGPDEHRRNQHPRSGVKRSLGKRSSRAPRMRWTTSLHGHFVHAVELLGGHESKQSVPSESSSLHFSRSVCLQGQRRNQSWN